MKKLSVLCLLLLLAFTLVLAACEDMEWPSFGEEDDEQHNWVLAAETATCTKPGIRYYTCTHCDQTLTENVGALGHKMAIVSTQEATCSADGSQTLRCSACGETTYNTIPSPGHKFTDGICERCGQPDPGAIGVP